MKVSLIIPDSLQGASNTMCRMSQVEDGSAPQYQLNFRTSQTSHTTRKGKCDLRLQDQEDRLVDLASVQKKVRSSSRGMSPECTHHQPLINLNSLVRRGGHWILMHFRKVV
jgi:hypothetical protein